LVVLRGQRVAAEYPIYEGRNTIGRFVDKPVDIDLVTQEPLEQVWCSRLHAAITFDRGVALVEDLNSLNGTWVNGARIHPGQLRHVKPNDVIQVGTVQMKLVAG
jgi:pSer/pThr/pTyr-binding forkhead associated (FHA) protein